MKLNLGCGFDKKEGYVNCDISKDVGADLVFDIEGNFPFKDNSVDKITIVHTLEHTRNPLNVLKEMYRVCKNKALILIRVPYFSSESAFSMLDHYSFYTWTSFDMLEENHPCHWQGIGNFKIIGKKLKWREFFYPFELLFNLFPRIYQELFCWIIPARELIVVLEVVK